MSNSQIRPNELSSKTKASMKTRILTAIIGCCVFVPAIILGDWFLFGFLVVVTCFALFECVHCVKRGYHAWLYVVTILTGLVMSFWPFIETWVSDGMQSHAYQMFYSMIIPVIVLIAYLAILFLTVILDEKMSAGEAFSLFGLVVLVSMGMQAINYARFITSYSTSAISYIPLWVDPASRNSFFNSYDNFASCAFLIYLLLGTFFTDIGAYFVGVFFGKHKINERISPNKTVEGFVGGIVISAAVSMAFGFILAGLGRPMLDMFSLSSWWNIVILSLIMPFFATLGDFTFSAIKRHYEIKDYGFILPGHGGILDRLDSIIFVFIIGSLYVDLFNRLMRW